MSKKQLRNYIKGLIGFGNELSDNEVRRMTDEIMRLVDRYTQTLLEDVLTP